MARKLYRAPTLADQGNATLAEEVLKEEGIEFFLSFFFKFRRKGLGERERDNFKQIPY